MGNHLPKPITGKCIVVIICRIEARKDQKAKYQRKRRRLVQQGVLIVTDREKGNLFYNSNYLSQHRYKDFNREQKAIERELKRLKLK